MTFGHNESDLRTGATAAGRHIDIVSALKQTELFAGLPDSVLNNAANRTTARQLKPGEVLFSEHDSASGLYVVVRGELRSIRQNQEGREQVLSTERAGAILAASPVFNGGTFYSTTIAETRSDVLCIPTNAVHALCREHPELLWNLARVFANKVRHYAELIETLALRNVDQRLAQYLLSMCKERGVPHEGGCVVEITSTQTEIASRIGSTREVTCRALARLQKSGFIRMTGARLLTVPDERALGSFAGIEHDLEGSPRVISELSSDIA